MEHFPLYLKLTGKRVALIGNSADIIPKARLLAKTSAQIDIFADVPCAALASYMDAARLGDAPGLAVIRHVARAFTRADLSDMSRPKLAFAYLDTPSADLLAWLEETHLPYCVIDDLAHSQFTTPALIDRSPVTIAIGTEGTAPVLARRLKAGIEDRLPPALGQVATTGGAFRERIGRMLDRAGQRRFWGRFFDRLDYQGHDVPGQIEAHAESVLTESLHAESHHAESRLADQVVADNMLAKPTGVAGRSLPHVMIVGAGPGDPAMLTVRARDILHEADIILHDRLVSSQVLELCRREAEFIDVGKTAYRASPSQGDVNSQMVDAARRGAAAGQRVVRLKGGDPVVFARLDEETAALDAAGIGFEVIPGISAAHAAAARMGLSLTRRRSRSQFRMLTGHDVSGFAAYDWRALAVEIGDGKSAVAVYMGVRAAPYLTGQLLMHGLDPTTPVTVTEHVSRPEMRVLTSTLGCLPTDMTDNNISGPAVIFLGLASAAAVQQSLSCPVQEGRYETAI